MPDIQASLEFLADIPLYEHEKPYLALVPPYDGFDPDMDRMDNLEWEKHEDITIRDIRDQYKPLTIENCGFQVAHQSTKVSNFDSPEVTCDLLRPESPCLLFCFERY